MNDNLYRIEELPICLHFVFVVVLTGNRCKSRKGTELVVHNVLIWYYVQCFQGSLCLTH